MRKRLLPLLMLALASSSLWAQYIEQHEKSAVPNAALTEYADQKCRLFNDGWRFVLGSPAGAERADFDDSAWRLLDLPHDYQFEQPWDRNEDAGRGFKRMCEGWYRKTFTLPERLKNRRVVLDFEGVMYVADVYVNGQLVASNEYGYTGFEADISKALDWNGENVVAVYSSTGPKNGSRWYTGGGIYRNVWLRVGNETRISRHGLYIQTQPEGTVLPTSDVSKNSVSLSVLPASDASKNSVSTPLLPASDASKNSVSTPLLPASDASKNSGTWSVLAQVQVERWQKHNVSICTRVRDAQGRVVASAERAMPDHTTQNNTEVMMPAMRVENPRLWDLDSPTLYTCEALLMEDGVVIDSVADAFGFRTIEYGPSFGFKLNGRKVFMAGIANHHDLGAVGVAAYPEAIERQLRQLKNFGFNAIRCSHNPYSDDFYRLCDRLGLLVVDELIDKWSDKDYWGGRKPFMQLWPSLLTEWVKRDRNHPSVVLWSLGNELQTRSDWSGYDTHDWGITTYRIFDQMVKRYDRRPTTVAMFPARAGAQRGTPDFRTYLVPPELACETEVASFNYQWDAYHGYYDFKPDLILFQSEATTNQLQQPYYGMARERGVGLCWWGAIEYWGESNGWPKKGWNYSFFSHTLQPYPQAWLIKACIRPEEPVVRIGVVDGEGESMEWNDIRVGQQRINRNWNQPEGSHPNVFTYTNADEVELFCNGHSLGTQRNDTTDIARRNIILWSGIDFGTGGRLTAVARKNGREVGRDEIETTGKAVRLMVEEDPLCLDISAHGISNKNPHSNGLSSSLSTDEKTLRYLNIYAIDSEGRRVPDATDEVSVTVDGDATFLALDNGDHYTDDLFLDRPTKPMQTGYMQCIIRAKKDAKKATLTVSSPTLKAAKIALQMNK